MTVSVSFYFFVFSVFTEKLSKFNPSRYHSTVLSTSIEAPYTGLTISRYLDLVNAV